MEVYQIKFYIYTKHGMPRVMGVELYQLYFRSEDGDTPTQIFTNVSCEIGVVAKLLLESKRRILKADVTCIFLIFTLFIYQTLVWYIKQNHL